MVAAPGMLLNAGKKLKEACAARAVPAPYLRDPRAIVPINLASSQKATCSCLVRFSTTFSSRIRTGLARELKLEGLRLCFLIFSFILSGVLLLFFFDSNFLEFLKLIDSC